MAERIAFAGLELQFLQIGAETRGSLNLFGMVVQPKARMPIVHHQEIWDETVYGLAGTTTWRVDGREVALGSSETLFIPPLRGPRLPQSPARPIRAK